MRLLNLILIVVSLSITLYLYMIEKDVLGAIFFMCITILCRVTEIEYRIKEIKCQ
jgi:hypothetical protein